jgi:hypothetical protein
MIHIFGLCLFAWAKNKRLKVLLADLCEKNTAGWLKISG